jgi:DNA-binding NarL/FixJ family response regulator
LICLPISHHQKREGIISAYFPSPDGPPEEQVQLLNIVAMPRMDGVEATRRISAAQPGTRVVILSVSDKDRDLIP